MMSGSFWQLRKIKGCLGIPDARYGANGKKKPYPSPENLPPKLSEISSRRLLERDHRPAKRGKKAKVNVFLFFFLT